MLLLDRDAQYPKVNIIAGMLHLILYTHDESTFTANDQWQTHYKHPDQPCLPQRKGEGETLMVSDFLAPEFRRLKHGDE
jgi:hypothetical protein